MNVYVDVIMIDTGRDEQERNDGVRAADALP